MTWPLSGSEAEVDPVSMQTYLLQYETSCCSHAIKFAYTYEDY